MSRKYRIIEYTFGPGDTVFGVLNKYNKHSLSKDELVLVHEYFIIENNKQTPRVGSKVRIPTLEKYDT